MEHVELPHPAEPPTFTRKPMNGESQIKVQAIHERKLEYRLGESSKYTSNPSNLLTAIVDASGQIKSVQWRDEHGILSNLPTKESEIEALILFLGRVLEETLPR